MPLHPSEQPGTYAGIMYSLCVKASTLTPLDASCALASVAIRSNWHSPLDAAAGALYGIVTETVCASVNETCW